MGPTASSGVFLATLLLAATLVLHANTVHAAASFKSPASCTPAVDCTYYFTWAISASDPTKLAITMAAQTNGWVAIGFSKTTGMTNSDVLMGYIDGSNAVTVTNRHSFTQDTPIIDSPNVNAISSISGSRVNGWTSISFLRTRQTGADATFDFDLGSGSNCPTYWMLFNNGPGVEGFHASPGQANGPFVSTELVNVCLSGSIDASQSTLSNKLTKTHGSLMLIAWLTLSPIATFVARYLKVQLTDNGLWFQLHRALQVLAVLLTVIGFIVIKRNDGSYEGPHSRLGLAILILALIQTLLGALRNIISGFNPKNKKSADDHGPRRWIFNWAHWLVGRSLLPITLANLYLGLDLISNENAVLNVYWAAVSVVIVTFIICEVLHQMGHKSQVQTIFIGALSIYLLALTLVLLGQVNTEASS